MMDESARWPPPIPGVGRPRWRVLVAEADRSLLEAVACALGGYGFDVAPAGSAAEALTYLDADPPIDALFTTIDLGPGPTGWELAEIFRRRAPDLPVLYATAYEAHQPSVPGALFYRKPYKPRQVIWGIWALARQAPSRPRP